MTIRVLIADDQPLMRAALRTCLEHEPDISVVGEAGDGRQAVSMASRLKPDVVLLDVRMPVLDGVEATRQLMSLPVDDRVRVLVITTFDLDEYIVEVLRAGASGFLIKDASAEEVVRAVRVIAAGEALLAPSVTRRLLDRYARFLPAATGAVPDRLAGLTNRELAVLQLACRGLTNAEIANSLHVAPSSVKTHIGHLLGKLHLTDRVQLVVFAYDNGLIQPGGRLAPDAAPGG